MTKDNEDFEREIEKFVDEQRSAVRQAQGVPDWTPKESDWEDEGEATWSNYIGPG